MRRFPSIDEVQPVGSAAVARLLQLSADSMLVVNDQLDILWGSANLSSMGLGVSGSMLDLIHPSDFVRVTEAFRIVLTEPDRIETITYRTSGRDVRYVESILRNCLSDSHINGVLVNTRDVTERIRHSQQVERSEARLQTLVDGLPVGVALCEQGRIAFVNRTLENLTGRDRSELIGLPPAGLVTREDRSHLPPLEQAAEDLPLRELRIERKHGDSAEAEVSGRAVRLEENRAWLLFFNGIADRKLVQARLAVTDRMVSVGTLAAGVAHEVNNPLAVMTMSLAFISDELERMARDHGKKSELAKVFDALDDARTGCTRVREIVRDLRTFSGADQHSQTKVDLRELLETCLSMTRNEIRHRAQLVKSLETVPLILANHAQLAQVFLNLLLNAVQAIREGDAARNELHITLREADGHILVSIRDTGSGIAAANLPRIFDPFFTTKPVGMGTGLGLSFCHNVVTGLGGTIQVQTTEGKGSTFLVDLPVIALDATNPRAVAPARRRTTLLIVDDDESIGLSLIRAWRDGHEISYVDSASRALALIREGKRFDAILCDLLMPDMSGNDLYDRLVAEAPDQARRMIFMTAGAFTPGASQFFEHRARWRLEKPFGLDQAESTIAAMLETLGTTSR